MRTESVTTKFTKTNKVRNEQMMRFDFVTFVTSVVKTHEWI